MPSINTIQKHMKFQIRNKLSCLSCSVIHTCVISNPYNSCSIYSVCSWPFSFVLFVFSKLTKILKALKISLSFIYPY